MDNFLFLPRALAATVYDVAFASASGLIVAGLLLTPGWKGKLKLQRKAFACALAMLIALGGQAWLLTATMAGSSELRLISPQLTEVITSTHAGRALLCNSAAALLFLLVLLIARQRQTRTSSAGPLTALALLAATRAATGHAAADGDFSLPEFVQFFHLVSIAIWSGGVMAAGYFVVPRMLYEIQFESLLAFTRRLSQLITIAILLVAFTGTYNSYRGLGASLSPLTRTQWGGFLIAKVVLVCSAVSLGAYNRRILRAGPSLSALHASRLARTLRVEAIVMLLILAVSAWLANSPPANSL